MLLSEKFRAMCLGACAWRNSERQRSAAGEPLNTKHNPRARRRCCCPVGGEVIAEVIELNGGEVIPLNGREVIPPVGREVVPVDDGGVIAVGDDLPAEKLYSLSAEKL